MIQTKNLSLVLLIFTIFLACLVIAQWSNRGQAAERVGWEYKVVENYGTPPGPRGEPGRTSRAAYEPERYFTELGADGWELVQFVRTDGGGGTPSGVPAGVYFFKRPR